MGDDRSSDTSSIWPTDELEFVNEFPHNPHHIKDSSVAQEREAAVSAAVSVVVASARHGVVALCASVAHIIREKRRLQQNVAELEKKITAYEKSSSPDMCVSCHCTSPKHVADTHGLLESPSSQRCGSAPPTFIASSLKLSRCENQNIYNGYQTADDRSVGVRDKCDSCKQMQRQEKVRSSAAIPDCVSHIQKPGERKTSFLQGQGYASSRSLNIGRSPPPSSFMRKKYSTISLRRVRRSNMNKQGVSVGTLSSSSSHRSSTNSLERRGSSSRTSSGSCIVTVAEVYSSPTPCLTPANTESDAVKLLARKLTNVLQGSEAHLEDNLPESTLSDSSLKDAAMPDISNELWSNQEELYAPHPLSGCECVVCAHLAADPNSHLYILTTKDGLLLPQGSTVLVQGDRIGTVVYFGHCKYPSRSSSVPQHHLQGSSITSINEKIIPENKVESSKKIAEDGWYTSEVTTASPLGVTITLWPPDYGEVFVPLSAVVCQLDDEVDIARKDHLLGLDLEYVDIDRCIAETGPSVFPDVQIHPTDMTIDGKHSEITSVHQPDGSCPSQVYEGTTGRKKNHDESQAQSINVPPYNSDYVQRLQDLSLCDQESEDDAITACGRVSLQVPEQENKTSNCIIYSHESGLNSTSPHHKNTTKLIRNFKSPCLKTAFLNHIENEDDVTSKKKDTKSKVFLYDTSDSAISLTFSQRPQSSEDSSQPPSLTDPDKESLNLGDTWDSGCCMERERYLSESSEQFSDVEGENINLGSPWALNLREALESVWEKHRNHEDFNLNGTYSTNYIDLSKREAQERGYSNRLQLLLENTDFISVHCDHSLTEYTEV